MTLKENWPTMAQADLRILATDIDPGMVATARRGVYTAQQVGDDPSRHSAQQHRETAGWRRIRRRPALKAELRFEELNLLGPWPFNGMFDVIFCRNVVIYFDAPTRMALWRRFAERLHPGGTLFVGHSERVDADLESLLEPSGVTQYRRTARPVVSGAGREITDRTVDHTNNERIKNMSLKNSLQIMVVDDMSVSRGLIENALDEIGLRRVDFKTDGQSALRSLVGKPRSPGHFRLQHARYGRSGTARGPATEQIHPEDRVHPDHRSRRSRSPDTGPAAGHEQLPDQTVLHPGAQDLHRAGGRSAALIFDLAAPDPATSRFAPAGG
jgi:CheY-like chemotaxis protein